MEFEFSTGLQKFRILTFFFFIVCQLSFYLVHFSDCSVFIRSIKATPAVTDFSQKSLSTIVNIPLRCYAITEDSGTTVTPINPFLQKNFVNKICTVYSEFFVLCKVERVKRKTMTWELQNKINLLQADTETTHSEFVKLTTFSQSTILYRVSQKKLPISNNLLEKSTNSTCSHSDPTVTKSTFFRHHVHTEFYTPLNF